MNKNVLYLSVLCFFVSIVPLFCNGEGETDENVTNIRFYGSDSQYNWNIISKFEEQNKDLKVQVVPIDFDNAEQIIKTGIASGNPVDVSFFWGSQISAFVNSGMATDMTPYLKEDNDA